MSSDAKATIWAAVIAGVLGIAGGVAGTLAANVTNDPERDQFNIQRAEVVKELTERLTIFISVRHDLMQHLRNEPPEKATTGETQLFIEQAKKLHSVASLAFREMRSSLILAGKVYGGDIDILVLKFLTWNKEQETKRMSLHVSKWVSNEEYEYWSNTILDKIVDRYN